MCMDKVTQFLQTQKGLKFLKRKVSNKYHNKTFYDKNRELYYSLYVNSIWLASVLHNYLSKPITVTLRL